MVLPGHRACAAATAGATPAAFAPHQPRRTPEARQIHQHHNPAVFRPQRPAATRTRRPLGAATGTQLQRLNVFAVDNTEHIDCTKAYQQLTHAYRVTFQALRK